MPNSGSILSSMALLLLVPNLFWMVCQDTVKSRSKHSEALVIYTRIRCAFIMYFMVSFVALYT